MSCDDDDPGDENNNPGDHDAGYTLPGDENNNPGDHGADYTTLIVIVTGADNNN